MGGKVFLRKSGILRARVSWGSSCLVFIVWAGAPSHDNSGRAQGPGGRRAMGPDDALFAIGCSRRVRLWVRGTLPLSVKNDPFFMDPFITDSIAFAVTSARNQ